jgi:hypothetical protein
MFIAHVLPRSRSLRKSAAYFSVKPRISPLRSVWVLCVSSLYKHLVAPGPKTRAIENRRTLCEYFRDRTLAAATHFVSHVNHQPNRRCDRRGDCFL